MASTTSYFDRFKKTGGMTAAPQSGSARTTAPQQSTYQSPYKSTTGIQAPQQYQPTQYNSPYQVTTPQNISPKLQQQITLQQSKLGNAASLFQPGQLATAGNIATADINQQLLTQQQSERDRQQAYEEYQRAWQGLGQSPESLAAKEAAMSAVQSGGPYNESWLDRQRGAIRNTGSVGLQSAQNALAEQLARRGMGGSSIMGLQNAQLGQQSALGIQQQVAEMEREAAAQNEAARQAALAQLSGLAGAEQSQRLGLDTAMAELYKEAQRTPIDTSPWAEAIKNPMRKLQ